jgi:hypothetical protein
MEPRDAKAAGDGRPLTWADPVILRRNPVTEPTDSIIAHSTSDTRSETMNRETMNRETIIKQLGADGWSSLVAAFDGLDAGEIEGRLDAMFPHEDNAELGRAIEAALEETRICILANDNHGTYAIQPNAEPEAWVDVVAHPGVSEVVPIEPLYGWGRWRWAYRVQRGPEKLTYFVDATPDAIEGP